MPFSSVAGFIRKSAATDSLKVLLTKTMHVHNIYFVVVGIFHLFHFIQLLICVACCTLLLRKAVFEMLKPKTLGVIFLSEVKSDPHLMEVCM